MEQGRVLIVDDNRLLRMLARTSIQSLGCEICEACDGEEALLAVREFRPDVVLLDVVMPKMNGFEVLAALRQDPDPVPCRVVMLSAAGVDEATGQPGRYTADANLDKPFNHGELRELVAGLLQDVRGVG